MIVSECDSQSEMLIRVSTPTSSRSSGPVMSAPGDGAGDADGPAVDSRDGADAGAELTGEASLLVERRLTAIATPIPASTATTAPMTTAHVILLFRIAEP